MTASDRRAAIVRDGNDARLLLVNVVTNNYFDVFQVARAASRMFTSAEASGEGAPPMVVIRHNLWRRQYNGDRQIIGRMIVASDVACVVVGVLPRAARGMNPPGASIN